MSTNTSKNTSSRKIAANRLNAQKSTGPRTEAGKRQSSMNHYSHGSYARLDTRRRLALEKLGEVPEDQDRLRQSLFSAWKPADAMQELMVADIANLYWKKLQLESMALSSRLTEKKRWDAEEQEKKARSAPTAPPGYVAGTPPPTEIRALAAFMVGREEACSLLEKIRIGLQHCDRLDEVAAAIKKLYAEQPSPRRRQIFALYERIAEAKGAADPSAGAELKRLIAEERDSAAYEYNLALRQWNENLQGEKDSIWKPGTNNWNLMIDTEAQLDEEIALKVKLLVQLQKLSPGGNAMAGGGEDESGNNMDISAAEKPKAGVKEDMV